MRALASHLPVEAAVDRGAVEFLVARHPPDRLSAVGLPAATRRLAWPGRLVTRTWVTLAAAPARRAARPARPGPPDQRRRATGRRPLVATVHDLAFRHFPDAYPAAGRRYHERSARIVADEAARVLVPSGTARDLAELYGVDRARSPSPRSAWRSP